MTNESNRSLQSLGNGVYRLNTRSRSALTGRYVTKQQAVEGTRSAGRQVVRTTDGRLIVRSQAQASEGKTGA
jgi:hypothetical protein